MLKLEAYRPTFQAAAPLYTSKQATRHFAESPVSLRPEWSEYPSPQFLLTLGLIGASLLLSLIGTVLPKHSEDTPTSPALTTETTPNNMTALIGLETTAIKDRFGAPALVRHEAPAEIWQYRNTNCVMDIFIYADSTPATVQHAEVRARHASTIPDTDALEKSCLNDLTVIKAN